MIITVTMNPAIDKTVEIDTLHPGGLNRITKVRYDAGGKGINVSKTLRELGCESIATGFLCGSTGRMIEEVLDQKGIRHDFLWGEGETRTNTKVCDRNGRITELNEPGPLIGEEQIRQLLEKIEKYAGKGTLFVLSGSVSSNMGKDIYGRIIYLAHEKGASVLLDADGELLRQGLPQKPDIIKPNRAELEEYCGSSSSMPTDKILKAARDIQNKGTGTVLVSMGEEGALLVKGNYAAFSPALSVEVHSTVGAGDAMAAALACAWDRGLSEEETFRLCMAAAAGAVMTVGTRPPERKTVDAFIKKVVIHKL